RAARIHAVPACRAPARRRPRARRSGRGRVPARDQGPRLLHPLGHAVLPREPGDGGGDHARADRRRDQHVDRYGDEPLPALVPPGGEMSAIVTQELREVTLAREARYLGDAAGKPAPEGPPATVHVRATSVGGLNEEAGSMKSGRTWTISEPEHVGGLANAPTPLEYLLSGAAGCFAAVFAFYAAKLDVPYEGFE